MKPRIFILVIFLISLGACVYWITRHTATVSHSLEPPALDAIAGTMSQPLPSPQLNVPVSIVDPKQFCGRKPACADDPTIPNNERELRWMQQHGYPTKEELDRLVRLSEVELGEEAKRGSLTAMTELGSRMVERNDPNGMKWFLQARNRGSIYSYYAESKTEMNQALGHGLVESGAFLRVAYMLGDYKASTALYQFVEREKLNIAELDRIDRRAAELYLTYAKSRQPAPRPME
jgi:hypothetical protein